MAVYEVTIALPGNAPTTLTIRDERDIERLSVALVEDGFVASQEVRVVRAGVEYEGHSDEYSAAEPVGEIALFAGSVLFIRLLEVADEE